MDTGTEALQGVRLPSSGRWGHLLQSEATGNIWSVHVLYKKHH